MGSLGLSSRKAKVVFVMGATGTGKSKLAIALATHFDGEIVNSDKMQVYNGLDIITNKVTEEERAAVPHHLLGGLQPDADFTVSDFRREVMLAIEAILQRERLPIIAGGSNRYIEELVDGEGGEFQAKYECCFIWVDVELPVLHEFVAERVDRMVEEGLVEEARGLFEPDVDYSRGVRRSIGVPEMDRYLRAVAEGSDEVQKARLLAAAINEIKANTCKLTYLQLEKIHRLRTVVGWDVKRIDATEAFQRRREVSGEEVWEKVVGGPSKDIVQTFLLSNEMNETHFLGGAVAANPAAHENDVEILRAGQGEDDKDKFAANVLTTIPPSFAEAAF